MGGCNIFRMGYARNWKIDMVVTANKRCKKIMLDKQWLLPWLSRDVIPKCQD